MTPELLRFMDDPPKEELELGVEEFFASQGWGTPRRPPEEGIRLMEARIQYLTRRLSTNPEVAEDATRIELDTARRMLAEYQLQRDSKN